MKRGVIVDELTLVRSKTFKLSIPHLQAKSGEVLCITGPNGSGKTSLIECIVGMTTPDTGSVTINGRVVDNNLQATRATIGYIPDDEAWIIAELCATEYLALLRSIYAKADVRTDMEATVRDIAKTLHFNAWNQQLGTLSHGNKKKVQIIAGLMHRPRLIVVDELRNGLDPLAIIAAEGLLRSAAARGSIIVATTHDLWWAERIASRVVLLIDGQLRLEQDTKSIVKAYGSVENLFLSQVSGSTG
jgi:ABC-2 type transport system ATP-binding protein